MNTKALRQKVLDLAIHGKLVPQNPNDESATVLLEKIRAEKAEKIKKGELKADKKDSFIFVGSDKRHYEQFADGTVKDIEDEIPFDVPDGWAWCRLGEVLKIQSGDAIKVRQNQEGEYPVYGGNGVTGYYSDFNVTEPTIIIGRVGFNCGSVHISEKKSWVTDNAFISTFNKSIFDLKYFEKILIFLNLRQFSNSTAQPVISGKTIYPVLVPVPPFAEQQHIINKIEIIYQQIDYLEENKTNLKSSIQQAKSKILDLAIHGKLVPQDPNEEPAEELLKRIAASDNRPYKKFDEDESLSQIPKGWTTCKLKNICSDFIVPQRDKPKSFDGTIPWCRIEDIEGKYLNGSLSGQLVTEETIKEMNMHKCPVGSIICSCSASLGVQAITTVECCTNQTFIGIVPYSSVLFNEYLYYLLKSQTKYFHEIATGTTIKYISRDKFEELHILLPPIQEQYRIVSKIEELFSYLDNITLNLV